MPIAGAGGIPPVFTRDVKLSGADNFEGIRVIKYHPDGQRPVHPAAVVSADVYLMKAEAYWRGGTSGTTALSLVNDLRQLRRRFSLPIGYFERSRYAVNKRRRELYWEGIRRIDQVRFGTCRVHSGDLKQLPNLSVYCTRFRNRRWIPIQTWYKMKVTNSFPV